jgi:FKBP-type peptidyl-prolyl cis-trans isomerase 2
MSEIKIGSKVKVHYVGTLKDGTEFDNSIERKTPLEVVIGEGKLLLDFENTIRTMSVGEKKKVYIPSEKAYGDIIEEAIMKVPRNEFPEDFRFIIDERIKGNTKSGKPATAVIVEVTKTEVTLDMNHPLAGKDLNFEIELLEIEK